MIRSRRNVARPGLGKERKPSPSKELVQSLRLRLVLTQQEVADRSGGLIKRAVVTDIEIGGNKITSRATFSGLALGLGITDAELEDLLARRVTVEDLSVRVLARDPVLAAHVAQHRGATRTAAE